MLELKLIQGSMRGPWAGAAQDPPGLANLCKYSQTCNINHTLVDDRIVTKIFPLAESSSNTANKLMSCNNPLPVV